jgi:5-methylcytosine-specific restriction endonuclease McrA
MPVAMRMTVLSILLSVVSNNALAEWVVVFRDQSFTVYANPATIRKTDSRVKMSVLYDYQSDQSSTGSKPYRSSTRLSEYDCNEGQSRILSLTGHSANMDEVDTVFSLSEPEAWERVPPASLGELIWKIACEKM